MFSLEYMAGFFDGEGCVNITLGGKGRQRILRVMIVNTNRIILEEFQKQFGGKLNKSRTLKENWKPFNCLTFINTHALDFLQKIYPFIFIKKRQIELAMEFREFMESPKKDRCYFQSHNSPYNSNLGCYVRKEETLKKELEFKQKMNDLNKRGTVNENTLH